MTKYLLTVLQILLSTYLYAQNNERCITGHIVDAATQTALPQATVRLFSLRDSTFFKGGVSNNEGFFRLNKLKEDAYILKVSFVGYQTHEESISLKHQKPITDIGTISLPADAITLGEAIVTAEAPPMTQIQDTTIFNTSAYRVPEGAMLEELVKKLPGAEVDTNGKITVNGKEVKRIMVDGKEFFSEDTQIAMKNLPVEMIDKVKTYDKKSDLARVTGIDDGEEETVLDLSVKKDMKKGWFGNFIGGYGNHNRFELGAMANRFTNDTQATMLASGNNTNNQGFSEFGDAGQGMGGRSGNGINTSQSVGLNLNIDRQKLITRSDIRYGHSNRDAWNKSDTETFLQNGSSYKQSMNTAKQERHEIAANIRLEWNPDSLTNIIFRPSVAYTQGNSSNKGYAVTLNNQLDSINYKDALNQNNTNRIKAEGSLQINRKFHNKKGRNLTMHVNYSFNTQNNKSQNFSQTNFYKNDSLDILNRRNDGKSNSYSYRVQITYAEPIFTNRFLLFSYSIRHREAHSQKYVYNINEQTEVIPNPRLDSLSNESENSYTTQEIQITFRTIRPKYIYNIGLNLEPQHSTTSTLLGPNTKGPMSQQVWNFSPTIDLRLRFSKQEQLHLMYRGKSTAPRIEDLQEVKDVTDPMNLIYGNPELKPSYSNRLALFYNRYAAKTQRGLMLNLAFSNTLNSTTNRITYDENTGARTTRLVNVNGNWNLNGFISFNTPLKNRKYTFSTYTNTGFQNLAGFISQDKSNSQKSTTRNLNLYERLNGNFRNDICEIGLWASVRYEFSKNNIVKENNRETFDYKIGTNANINLPWDLYLSTDLAYNLKRGYGKTFDRNTVLWNAQLSKNLLKNKQATLRIKIYDILQQQTNLTHTVTANYTQDSEYNTLNSYFIVHFVYRLNTMSKKAKGKRAPGKMPRKHL